MAMAISPTFLGFGVLVVLVALGRLVELRVAARHRRALLAQGAVEVGARHYPWMVALHSAFLIAAPLEVWLFDRPFLPGLAALGLALVLAATGLRWWVIRTLGERWTTRVLCLPGAPLITGGPFRFLRHPNYLAVIVEIAALPLVHSAYLTAGIFTVLNAVLLRHRVRVEEAGLARATESAER
jgi:methyltransferase